MRAGASRGGDARYHRAVKRLLPLRGLGFHVATRIGIAGITGRMGQLLVEEVPAAGAELTGGIGRPVPRKAAAVRHGNVRRHRSTRCGIRHRHRLTTPPRPNVTPPRWPHLARHGSSAPQVCPADEAAAPRRRAASPSCMPPILNRVNLVLALANEWEQRCQPTLRRGNRGTIARR